MTESARAIEPGAGRIDLVVTQAIVPATPALAALASPRSAQRPMDMVGCGAITIAISLVA
jgi:hypothetical protein